MKKSIIGCLVVATMAFFVAPAALSAEKMVNWTWKRYNLKFKLPKSWKVTKNTKDSFIAKGGWGLFLRLVPIEIGVQPQSQRHKKLCVAILF